LQARTGERILVNTEEVNKSKVEEKYMKDAITKNYIKESFKYC
jgi:hypothetical protein